VDIRYKILSFVASSFAGSDRNGSSAGKNLSSKVRMAVFGIGTIRA